MTASTRLLNRRTETSVLALQGIPKGAWPLAPIQRSSLLILNARQEATQRIPIQSVYIISQILLHTRQVARTQTLSNHLKDGGKQYQEDFYELNDGNVEAFVRNSVGTELHPADTCSMGPRSEGGVADEKLKVHGTSNLRVVDASVFPTMVRGDLASLVYAVAERAAGFVKEDQR